METQRTFKEPEPTSPLALPVCLWRTQGFRVQEAKEMRFSDFEKRIFKETGFFVLLAIVVVVFDIRWKRDD